MLEGGKLGTADVQSKNYFDDKSVFADAFNYYVYGGDLVIKPADLSEVDASELGITEDKNIRPDEVRRDTVFEWTVMEDDCATYALLLGIEGQTLTHYAMPARCADYDARRNMAQVRRRGRVLRKLTKEGKVRLTQAERMSWFMKTDRIKPVVTIVFNLGKEPWDGPTTLHEMLNVSDERILEYVWDYKINLIDPYRMGKEDFSKFNTELGLILEITKNARTWDDLSKMKREDMRLKNVSQEGVRLLRETIDLNLSSRRFFRLHPCAGSPRGT